jgi:Holliday junction resolvase
MGITKDKGNLAEAKVAAFLIQSGFHVLIPWGENHRYDLVAEKGGLFTRIQVKFVSPKSGRLQVPLRSANNWKVVKYDKDQIDPIAVFNPENENIYFVPLEKFKNTATINLRLINSKNNQKKNLVLAKDFENRIVLPA